MEVAEIEPPEDASIPRKPHVRQGHVFRQGSPEALMPVDLRSLVPEDDPSLWLKEGLLAIDLSPIRRLYEDCGGIPYDPRPMLGILLLGCLEGVTGSGTLEKRCLRDVAYIYVSDGLKPDDKTIRRFRRRIGPALPEIFQAVVKACGKADLLKLRRVAADGTRIASACSQVGRWLKDAEKKDIQEMGLDPPECSDPDARNLGKSGTYVLGYNGQAVVDCDSGVVVAVSLDNVSSDGHHLPPLARQVVANVGAVPEELVADAGYDTHEGATTCEELGMKAIIASKEPLMKFWTVTHEDKIVCPLGNEAMRSGEPHLNKETGKMYQELRVQGCSTCPLYDGCCESKGARTLKYPEGADPVHRINSTYRARSPEGKAAMRERLATIEPVFADIKWNKGLKRFKLRGLAGARIEWTLIHMARNLAKLGKALKAAQNGLLGRISKTFLQLAATVTRNLRRSAGWRLRTA
jgi:transposase